MPKCGTEPLHEKEVYDRELGLGKYRSLRVLQNHHPLISRRSQTKVLSEPSPKTALLFIFPQLQPIRTAIGHPKGSIRGIFRTLICHKNQNGVQCGVFKNYCAGIPQFFAEFRAGIILPQNSLRRRMGFGGVQVSYGLEQRFAEKSSSFTHYVREIRDIIQKQYTNDCDMMIHQKNYFFSANSLQASSTRNGRIRIQ